MVLLIILTADVTLDAYMFPVRRGILLAFIEELSDL
jgi:hypothetical protein